MNNSNYYIAVDESGQPYIAHMQPSDRGTRGGRHKYMAKFENFFNNGKAFYAYTQEQVRQAINRGRSKAKSQLNFRAKQIKTRAGVAKRELNKAADRAKVNIANTADKARRDLEFRSKQIKTRFGVAERAINKAASHIKKHATETLSDIKSQLNFRGKQIKTRAGVAERAINKAADQIKKHGNETLSDVKTQLNFRGKQIQTRAGVAERELNKAAQNVKTGAANTANNIKTRANEIIKNATKGGDIKEQRDALLSAYKQASAGKHPDDRALAAALKKELNRVNKEYEKTWKYQAEMGKKKLETRAKSVF